MSRRGQRARGKTTTRLPRMDESRIAVMVTWFGVTPPLAKVRADGRKSLIWPHIACSILISEFQVQ